MSLRERNRRNTLATTQRVAIEMFSAEGFEAVKVVDIAAAAEMAPSTLYRYFPTKEAIVLWDEHDEAYGDVVADALTRLPPYAALREAFVDRLTGLYEADAAFQLQRVSLIYREPAIYAAAAAADASDRRYLAELVARHLSSGSREAAELLAGAALLASDWAFNRWQASDGSESLGGLIGEAFDHLAYLDALA